jgi:glycine/D-amino acid oxidase-like deaminating enzyme
LLLIVVERRKPARPRVTAGRVPIVQRETTLAEAVELPVRRYKRTPIWRRFIALVGLGTSGLMLGALLALSVAGVIIGLLWFLSSFVK